MRFSRSRVILFAILIFIVAVILWFFMPLHPSARKDVLRDSAYISGMVRLRPLMDKPFSSIMSVLPGSSARVGNIPFFMRPVVPPAAKFYLQGGKEGEGWAVVADLGWRSRLFSMLHGIIIGQMQYRGMGAIEGGNILRTPSGTRVLFYQDGRTLFVAEGEKIIEKITGPDSIAGTGTEGADIQGSAMGSGDRKVITSISFSNIDGDITRGVEMLEDRAGFILLPSAASLIKGRLEIRKTGSDTIAGTIELICREDGDIAGLEGDVTYIIALLDRLLSTQNMKTDSSVKTEGNNLTVNIMIHPEGERQ